MIKFKSCGSHGYGLLVVGFSRKHRHICWRAWRPSILLGRLFSFSFVFAILWQSQIQQAVFAKSK
jgi:hypothetical protein